MDDVISCDSYTRNFLFFCCDLSASASGFLICIFTGARCFKSITTGYRRSRTYSWGDTVTGFLAGEYTDAEGRLNQALELFQGLDTRWQAGRTRFELGELALARTDTPTARDHFSQALAAFEELRAAPSAARSRAALESLD